MDRSISTSPPVAVTKLTMTPAREWLGAIAAATLRVYVSLAATPEIVYHTDVRILQRLLANLNRRSYQHYLTEPD